MPEAEGNGVALTPAGKSTAVIATALTVLALLGRNSALAVTALTLGATLSATIVATRRRLHLTATVVIEAHPVMRRTSMPCRITVSNVGSRRTGRFTVQLALTTERMPWHARSLRPGDTVSHRCVLTMPRRGDHVVGPLMIERTDLLHLHRRVSMAGVAVPVRVYPREHPTTRVLMSSARPLDAIASTSARRRGADEFHSLRDYVRGDDIRRIHWRTTARTGRLMVRDMLEQQTRQMVIFLDDRIAAMTPDEFDDAVDVVASIARAAEVRGLGIRLSTTSATVTCPPGSSAEPVRDFLTSIGQTAAGSWPGLSGHETDGIVAVTGALFQEEIGRVASTAIVMSSTHAEGANVTVGLLYAANAVEAVDRWNTQVAS